MAVNYEDERFGQVESDKEQAMTELEQTYGGMIDQTDDYYQAQIDATQQWADTQTQLQQEQTDFAIQEIEQQKEQAQKDYTKEQSGAYVDWQKQSNQYGVQAEQMASAGLAGTGFSESSQVSMYNTYQNRVATARESYNQAVLNYNNAITEARLQNNSALAEIAHTALMTQLELSLQGFQYKNQLILEQANKKVELDNMYYQRYQDVLAQINHENAMAEEIRQYNQNYELQVKQYNESVRQFEKTYELQIKEFNESIRQFNEEIARLKKKDEQEYKLEIERLELEKQKAEEDKRQFEAQMALEREKLEEEQRQFNSRYGGSSGGGGGGSSNKGYTFSTGSNNSGSKQSGSNLVGVIDLGRGPLSEDGVAKLVASGAVTATQNSNGTISVKNNPNYIPGTDKLNQYTGLATYNRNVTNTVQNASKKTTSKSTWRPSVYL